MKIKICGITNFEDAYNAIHAGANALGFVFYPSSKRYITPSDARIIIDRLPPFVQMVGLFVHEDPDSINQICQEAHIDLAQIIVEDSRDEHYFERLTVKYMQVIRVKNPQDIHINSNAYYLVDAFVEGFGGAGKRIALEWFDQVDCSRFILAGGLRADTIKELKPYKFYGVDISSGVEYTPGKKDKNKMIEFIQAVHAL